MGSIYERLFGITPIVNGMGTMTALGGSRMHPEVVGAFAEASEHFVDLNLLLRRAGDEVARLARAPEGYSAHIVTGAAAGLVLSVAAAVTGCDPSLPSRLPFGDRSTRPVLLDGGSDTRWNQVIGSAGVDVVVRGTPDEPLTASGVDDAMRQENPPKAIVYFAGGVREGGHHGCLAGSSPVLRDEEVIALGRRHRVPVIIDAAALLPPSSNLWKWTTMGADAVIFSGGKAIGGPQTSGIILGKEELIANCRRNGSPNEATVGRGLKCAKEDVVALVVALKRFVTLPDPTHRQKAMVHRLIAAVQGVPGVEAVLLSQGPPDVQPNYLPRLLLTVRLPGCEAGQAAQATDRLLGASADHGNPLQSIIARSQASPAAAVAAALASSNPPICVNTTSWVVEGGTVRSAPRPSDGPYPSLIINPQVLSDADVDLISHRLREALLSLTPKL